MKAVTDRLDGVFLADKDTRAYCAFKEVIEFRRGSGVKFADFIIDFERLDREVGKYMTLPSGCRAFLLLHAANLSEELEKLARATSELTYDDMKSKLMKIFGNPKGDFHGGAPLVKQEALLTGDYDEDAYVSYQRSGSRGGRDNRGGRRGRGGRGARGGYRGAGRGRQWQNPIDRDTGLVRRCHLCDSTKHFASACPHRDESRVEVTDGSGDHEEAYITAVHITLFNGTADAQRNNLLAETFGKGILDSACTKTVAGNVWLVEYLATLSSDDLRMVKEKGSKAAYLFGDGIENRSEKCVTIPVWLDAKPVTIDVEIVENTIPLLISLADMKRMGMIIDYTRDLVFIGNRQLSLGCTSMGHYYVSLT